MVSICQRILSKPTSIPAELLGHGHHAHALPWRQCVRLITEELSWLKGRDLELVMGRAVCDWLGWKR